MLWLSLTHATIMRLLSSWLQEQEPLKQGWPKNGSLSAASSAGKTITRICATHMYVSTNESHVSKTGCSFSSSCRSVFYALIYTIWSSKHKLLTASKCCVEQNLCIRCSLTCMPKSTPCSACAVSVHSSARGIGSMPCSRQLLCRSLFTSVDCCETSISAGGAALGLSEELVAGASVKVRLPGVTMNENPVKESVSPSLKLAFGVIQSAPGRKGMHRHACTSMMVL
jgi:hypothetical protein